MPCSYTSEYGMCATVDEEPVSSITRSARAEIEMRFVAPTLKISPDTASSIRPRSALIVSCTWQKQRVWSPSPWISSGRPSSAR